MKKNHRFRMLLVFSLVALLTISSVLAQGLELTKVKAYVNGDRDNDLDLNGGELTVIPGDEIKLQLTLENSHEELDVEEVYVSAELDDLGDDESPEFDVDADDKETVSLQFNVPLDADEDDYELVVEFEAEDEEGNDLTLDDYTALVKVEKEEYHLQVSKLEFRNQVMQCGEKNALHVELANVGTKDVDVQLFVRSDDLHIALFGEKVEVEEEESLTDSFEFTVPDDVLAGDYQVLVVPQHRHYDEDTELAVANVKVNCEQKKDLASKFKVVQKQTKVVVLEDSVPNKLTGYATTRVEQGLSDDFDRFVESYKNELAYASMSMFALLLALFVVIVRR